MKLPKPKYDVSVIDKAQFLIQLVLGFILGNVAYSLVFSLIQLFENQKFMNSDEKVYTASVGIQILAALLSILLVHIGPVVFQSVFIRSKAADQYEDSENNMMWLSKGLRYMLAPSIIFGVITTGAFLVGIVQVVYIFMPGYNFTQLIGMLCGWIVFSSESAIITFSLILNTVCPLIYLALHTTALLFIYRYFWNKWEKEKNTGKVRMSEDAYTFSDNDNSK